MSKNIESETKALLTEEQYQTLLKEFNEPIYSQTNFYFDSYSRVLNKNGISLRIRKKKLTSELTIKLTQIDGSKIELNFAKNLAEIEEITANPDYFLKIILKKELNFETKEKIVLLTSLTTERTDKKYMDCLLSLDKNSYSGITDFEIECEAKDMQTSSQVLFAFLAVHKIKAVQNSVSKQKRAINAALK